MMMTHGDYGKVSRVWPGSFLRQWLKCPECCAAYAYDGHLSAPGAVPESQHTASSS
jgi:hypothetical protein